MERWSEMEKGGDGGFGSPSKWGALCLGKDQKEAEKCSFSFINLTRLSLTWERASGFFFSFLSYFCAHTTSSCENAEVLEYAQPIFPQVVDH